MSGRRVIRVFPDWGHEWPLWESSTPERETKYTMAPSDYGLSEELTARLRAWYDYWAEHGDWNGWDDPANEEPWVRAGRSIAWDLRHEVADFADVRYEVGDRPEVLD